ncbi:MAG: PAS domain S-box protein [Desulfobacterium sp.]|nr:PAS domain S-box protein [Desulfobacterium sp.]
MKLSTKLFAMTLIPLLSSMLLTCIIVSLVMHGDITRQVDQVRSIEEQSVVNGVQGRVETAWSIIEDCFNRGVSQEECKKYLTAIRFGDNNYLWVHRMDPTLENSAFIVVHPDSSFVNREQTDIIDLDRLDRVYYRGRVYEKNDPEVSHLRPIDIFREFNAICLQQGEGSLWYYWPKVVQGEKGDIGYYKISYVKLFKPWNWVVGAGEYADHIDNLVIRRENEIRQAQKMIYLTIFGIFVGVALFFGVVASAISKKVADRLDQTHQKMLDSRQQLKVSEKRLLDIAFCSADFIWEVDKDGIYCFVAGHTENNLGYAPAELVGKTPLTFMVEEERADVERYYRKLARGSQPVIDHKVSCVGKNGNRVIFLRNASPIMDAEGRVTGYRGVDRDITDRIQEEEKRILLERELSISQKLEAVGTLAAGIAHEINTPIQFIGDNTTFLSESMKDLFDGLRCLKEMVLQMDDEDDTIKKAIAEIEEEYDFEFLEAEIPQALNQSREGVERVTTIVRTMKDFSHMGTGSFAEEDINKAIETTITISRNEWKYVAEMKTDLDPALPFVTCYIGDIKQVILNLILNAAHTIQDALALRSEPMGCITIRTHANETDAVIEISDTGMGIDHGDRDRVFEHFFTTKEVGKGTGQGLSMAYQTIVEKHKGQIEFTTESAKGTTFIIRLPLIQPEPRTIPMG